MIQETIAKIEARIAGAEPLTEAQRQELLDLLKALRKEIAPLTQTHHEQAQSIAGFAQVSAHEATRARPDPRLVKLSLEGLAGSVRDFEHSHPELVRVVNAISQTLANLGI